MDLFKPEIFGPLCVLLGVVITQVITFLKDRKKEERTHLRETSNDQYQRLIDENARLVAERESAQEDYREQRELTREATRVREAYRQLYEYEQRRVTILEQVLYTKSIDIPAYPIAPEAKP